MKTTIYRTGQMSVPIHRDYVLKHWAEFEARRPEGHLNRSEVLFASPDLQGAHRWLYDGVVLSNRHATENIAFNEIAVESDNVLVYDVAEYNKVGDFDYYRNYKPTSEQITHINNYWNSSMTLTEWMQENSRDFYGYSEVLLPESEVISSRVLTYAEIREKYIEEGITDARLDRQLAELRIALEKSEASLVAV